MVRRQKAIWILCLLMTAGLTTAFSASALVKAPINTHDRGVTIKGYDTVAYFTKGRPVKGTEQFSYTWNGGEWLFSSKEHMEIFKSAEGLLVREVSAAQCRLERCRIRQREPGPCHCGQVDLGCHARLLPVALAVRPVLRAGGVTGLLEAPRQAEACYHRHMCKRRLQDAYRRLQSHPSACLFQRSTNGL